MGSDAPPTHFLLVSEATEHFALPQESVSDTLRLTPAQAARVITARGSTHDLLHKGRAIPLFRLAELLCIPLTFTDEDGRTLPDRRIRLTDRRDPVCTIAEDAHQWDERIRIERRVNPSSGTLHIVVVKTNARMYALLVHEIHGTAGVSVKPVGRGRKLGKGYMGTAMLGNGRTAYVLDPVGIAILAGIA